MKKKVFAIFVVMALVLAACVEADKPSPEDAPFYAPDFTLTSMDGTQYTLSDLRGSWVIINFWATWCKPCIEEMPALQTIAQLYQDDLTVLGINLQETDDAIQPFLDELDITYPILSTRGSQVPLDYQVVSLPQTLILNPDGEIVWRHFGSITLDVFSEKIQAFVGKPSNKH